MHVFTHVHGCTVYMYMYHCTGTYNIQGLGHPGSSLAGLTKRGESDEGANEVQQISDDPGVKRQTLARRVKTHVTMEDATARREQAEAQPCQDQMLWDSSLPADLVWATAVSRLGSEDMKFALTHTK